MSVVNATPSSQNFFASDSGYENLIASFGDLDKASVICEMESVQKLEIKDLVDCVKNGDWFPEQSKMHRTTIIALRALNEGSLSLEQLATMHILDAAYSSLICQRVMYAVEFDVDDSGEEVKYVNSMEAPIRRSVPVRKYTYKQMGYSERVNSNKFPTYSKFLKPILQRYFSLNEEGWKSFCEKMEKTPLSERYFTVIPTFAHGCWSGIVARIQSLGLCLFQEIDFLHSHCETGELLRQKIAVVPSFSMFQAFIDCACESNNSSKVTLIPTYGFLEEGKYVQYKRKRQIPVSLYFPRKEFGRAYNPSFSEFRFTLDGWDQEGIFAAVIHDINHAFEETKYSDTFSNFRYWLAEIVKGHPDGIFNRGKVSVYENLVDADFDYSVNNVGDLLYSSSVIRKMTPELKGYIIRALVDHATFLKDSYGISKDDLREEDQILFDKILRESTA
ncbi:MAG: hypothetical protein VX777_07555 [Chlamydiota bacterium]|nr:hypothetical protein [Chlamydiota bacterium]